MSQDFDPVEGYQTLGRDPQEDMAFITQPTLIVNGDKDMQVPTENSYIMYEKIKTAN